MRLLAVCLMITLLVGCNTSTSLGDSDDTTSDTPRQESEKSTDTRDNETSSLDTSDTMTQLSCEEAIQAWLDQETTHGDKTVADGHNITVHYIGRLNESEVFDTSVESVARACGKHTPGRDYSAGLSFNVGAGQMIAGFDAGVVDKKHGEIFTISIPAAEAYGEYDDTRTQTVSRDQLPAGDFAEGDKLMDPYGRQFAIKTITDTEVILDLNHELAGKDLIFDIMIMDIQE